MKLDLDQLFYSVNKGLFKLSCPSARLAVVPAYQEIAFEGSGFLRCTQSGEFEYELLVRAVDKKWIQEINHCIPHNFPPEYFQLQLTDQDGVEWLGGDWTRPRIEEIDSAYKGDVFAIKGYVSTLVTSSLDKFKISQANDFYQFIVPNAGIIPWQKYRTTITTSHQNQQESLSRNPCYQTLEINSVSLLMEKLDNTEHMKVTIKANHGCIPPFFDIKVLETIIFITGRIMNIGVQLRKGENQRCIRIIAEHEHLEIRQFPPVSISGFKAFDQFWSAFGCVLKYLLENDSINPFFHPLIETLIPVMEAGSRTAGIHSLTLAVAVESIVNNCRFSKAQLINNYSDSEVEELKKYIREKITNTSFKNRLEGSIASITSKTASVSDRLRDLVESNVITKKQFESWKSLRHTSAHGGFYKVSERENFDEMFGDVYSLVNTLILREVGYDGDVTDYGAMFSLR